MKKVTAIVISFLRPGYTKACIRSLRKTYPKIRIIVGENGKKDIGLAQVCNEVKARYVMLPFDSGVCVGRNKLLELVKTKYVLVGDDDFFYTEKAGVDKMKKFLDKHGEYDLVGGRVTVGGVLQNYQGYTKKVDRHFESTPIDPETIKYQTDDIRYCQADLTFNYFVARTEKIRPTPWDEKIKVAYEHYSWFYDFKCAGGKVAFSPNPVVIHKPEHVNPEYAGDYASFRNRKSDRARFFQKYDIDYSIDMRGHISYSPLYTRKKEINMRATKYVDFCITTFKRPKALRRLLISIARHFPMANVYVADQNEKLDRVFYKKMRRELEKIGLSKRLFIIDLPYDCGLAHARNYLVLNTPNKYKLILDDDMAFTEETDIGKMVTLLDQHPKCGIVGGMVKQLGHEIHFEFSLEIIGNTIMHTPDGQPTRDFEGISYRKTGCVLNFAMMRKDMFGYIQWDRNLKVTEHTDFYLQMKKVPMYILYTPDVVVNHPPVEKDEQYSEYKALRQRKEFMVKMLKKYKVTRVKYLNGQVTELMPDGALKRYKELPIQ
ncbi:hypothetical protein DRQ25_00935 [Candidatus Fermentibacteria bacterium]|nr:MAG: hypothetical protein DRQ25_00935 [Candidatus Fermentibacteria bacterium]